MIDNPKFVLNENNGGINWGYCKQQLENSQNKNKKKYIIYVSTSPDKDSATRSDFDKFSSVIFITLKGADGESSEQILSSKGFKVGSYEKIKIFAEDVGNIKSIKVLN